MKTFFLLLLGLYATLATAQSDTVFFYVSPSGNTSNPGSLDRPFATVQQARDAVRKHRSQQPGTCYTVYFRTGRYFMAEPFELTAVDSGSAACPVRYAGFPGETVVLHGGQILKPEFFKTTTNPDIRRRLPPGSRGRVMELDLKKLGISNFGKLEQHGFGQIPQPAPLELFIDGERQPLARFPNSGQLPIGKIHDPGAAPRYGDFSRRGACFGYEYTGPERWLEAGDAWLHGRFSFGYCDDHLRIAAIDTAAKTITTAQPHLYGLLPGLYVDTTEWLQMAGHSLRGFYVYNLLEELDLPGEWFLDRTSGLLYLFPPENFATAKIEISLTETPLLRLSNTAQLIFENLEFQTSRGLGIYLENAHHIAIMNCRFANLGTAAISMGQPLQNNRAGFSKEGAPLLDDWRSTDFHHISIKNCLIEKTGTGGIILAGGNRRTLISAENVVSGCSFSRTDQINFSYAPAIKLFGVGAEISHCAFRDMRHMAIALHGNDHRIAYNRFERICTNADDMGAIYAGRDPSARGTQIFHNYFRDILPVDSESQVAAIFLDDGIGGIDIGHNYFERVGSPGDGELFGAVALNGGHGNTVHHNVFQDCEVVIGNNYWDLERWKDYLASPIIRERLFEQVDVSSPVYREKYPDLWEYVSGAGPRLCKIAENILINSNLVLNGRCEFYFNHLELAERIEQALERIEFDREKIQN